MTVLGNTTRGLTMALLVAVLAGCAVGSLDPPVEPRTPQVSAPPTSGPPIPREDGPLRQRLVDSLSPTDPSRARLVETAKLTVVATPWLAGWQIVDVVNSTLPHPQRFYLGVPADGPVRWLTADIENFNQMMREADPHVDSAKVSAQVANIFVDTNRTFLKASYRIEGVKDIQWLPKLTAEQTRVRRQVETIYGESIRKPQARRSGTGWLVSVWVVYDHQLIRHDLDVADNGVITDRAQTVFDGLPTPDSI
jgi:hypothetical protein